MATLVPLSGQPVFNNGLYLSGAKVRVYDAGTTTPHNVYTSSALTTLHSNPVLMTGSGVFPTMFVGVGAYKLRIEDSGGALVREIDGLTGDTEIAAEAGEIDPTGILGTGDVKWRYGSGTLAGYVRLNARTIGNGASGASERANADTAALFEYLWNTDASLAVSGGRGASGAADYAANKTIALPDAKGAALFGLDGMGGATTGRLTGALFSSGNATTLGSIGGLGTHTLTEAQIAAHDHALTMDAVGAHTHTGTTDSAGAHTHAYDDGQTGPGGTFANPGTSYGTLDINRSTSSAGAHTHPFTTAAAGGFTPSGTISEAGSGDPHNNMPPFLLGTFYMKL